MWGCRRVGSVCSFFLPLAPPALPLLPSPPLLSPPPQHSTSPSTSSTPAAPSSSAPAGAAGLFGSGSALPWRQILTNKCFWALLWAHSVFGVGYSFFIAWLPTYYSQVRKVSGGERGKGEEREGRGEG